MPVKKVTNVLATGRLFLFLLYLPIMVTLAIYAHITLGLKLLSVYIG